MNTRAIIVFGTLGCIAATYLFGAYSARNDIFPIVWIEQVVRQVNAWRHPEVAEIQARRKKGIRTLDSIFFPITSRRYVVGPEGDQHGGGLAMFEDEVVIMSWDGSIFSFYDGSIAATGLHAPDNGNAQYLQNTAVAALANAHTRNLRYHDLHHYSDEYGSYLLASYTEWRDALECYGTTIARLAVTKNNGRIAIAKSVDWQVIYRSEPCLMLHPDGEIPIHPHMAGSRMTVDPNRGLLLSVGDYGDYALTGENGLSSHSQNMDAHYGKVLQIDLTTGIARIVSSGHRNPQGLLVRSDGEIFVTEHGPRGGDELNLIVESGNYGWPYRVLGTDYDMKPYKGSSILGRHQDFKLPLFAWLPSVAPSNLIEIQNFHPSWNGDLLVGTLGEQSFQRLRLNRDRIVFSEPIKINARVRDIVQHPNGPIYIWTDSHHLVSFTPEDYSYTENPLKTLIREQAFPTMLAARVEGILSGCLECHTMNAKENTSAPGLAGIFGRKIAQSDYTNYSDALSSRSGVWTRNELDKFLHDTTGYVPGTTMPNAAIDDPKARNAVLDVLEQF